MFLHTEKQRTGFRKLNKNFITYKKEHVQIALILRVILFSVYTVVMLVYSRKGVRR